MTKFFFTSILFLSFSSFATDIFTISETQFLKDHSEAKAIQVAEGNIWDRANRFCKRQSEDKIAIKESDIVVDKDGLRFLDGILVEISFTCY